MTLKVHTNPAANPGGLFYEQILTFISTGIMIEKYQVLLFSCLNSIIRNGR